MSPTKRWGYELIDYVGGHYAEQNMRALKSGIDESLYDGLPLADQIRHVFAVELEYRPEVEYAVDEWLKTGLAPELSHYALRFFVTRLLNATITLGDILLPSDNFCMIPVGDKLITNEQLLTWLLKAQWERRYEHLLKAIVVSRRLDMPLFGTFPARDNEH